MDCLDDVPLWPDPQEGRLHLPVEVAESTFVSPPRLPQWKSTVLYDARSPAFAPPKADEKEAAAKASGADRCVFGHELHFVRGRPAGLRGSGPLVCARCQMCVDVRSGFGHCGLCSYSVCTACLRNAADVSAQLRAPPVPPAAPPLEPPPDSVLPFPRLTTAADKTGTIWGVVPGVAAGRGSFSCKIHAPPPSRGLLPPRGPDQLPPSVAASARWLQHEWERDGGTGGPQATITQALMPEALLGGQPGDPGAPLGRQWVVRGDDAVAAGACERALEPGELVAWHGYDTGMLACGCVLAHSGGPRDSYIVRVHDTLEDPSQRRFLKRLRFSPAPKASEEEVLAVRLAPITEHHWSQIKKQWKTLERVMAGVCHRMLSLIDGCTHTDGPTLRRRKGRSDRGLLAEYAQCRWCGKVLCVNWQTTCRETKTTSFWRTEYDDVGAAMLQSSDPHADGREFVKPILPHGMPRPAGRGWTRKVVLFIPELQQLTAAGFMHPADCRWLCARRAHAPDAAQWETSWHGSPFKNGWATPLADSQVLYGPSLLLAGVDVDSADRRPPPQGSTAAEAARRHRRPASSTDDGVSGTVAGTVCAVAREGSEF